MLTGPSGIGGHGEKRSRRRTIAIGCLLSFPTVKAAAKAAGIAEITLHRWLKDPQFAADYRQARENVLRLAAEELREGSLSAVRTLREIAVNKRLPASARVVACRSFLEATGLLKGLGVQVTVNNQLPTDLAGINELLVKQARSVLANDPELRKIFTAVIAEIEEGVNENGERTEPVLQ